MRRAAMATLAVLLLAACGGGTAGTETTGSQATTSTTAAVMTTTTTAAPSTVLVGPGDTDLSDPSAGLAGLARYSATLTVAFEGTSGGAATQWTSVSTMLVAGDDRLLTVANTGDLEAADPPWLAIRDGARYELDPDGACVARVASPDDPTVREPASLLATLIGGEALGHDVVNGREADGYRFDGRALGQDSPTVSEGEMWLATDGGFVVRYRLETTGGAEYFGEGSEGTLTWEYELTAGDESLAVVLPEDCPPGLLDVPMPADAGDVESFPGMLSFVTSSDVDAVIAFYQGVAGWTVIGDPAGGTEAGVGVADFDTGDLVVTVIATAEGDTTIVQVVADPA